MGLLEKMEVKSKAGRAREIMAGVFKILPVILSPVWCHDCNRGQPPAEARTGLGGKSKRGDDREDRLNKPKNKGR